MKRAFTLIEVLVVIAILGVLMAITMPAFASVRSSGRRVVCLTSLRSFGQGLEMYLNAGDGLLPRADRAADFSVGRDEPFSDVADYLDAPWPAQVEDAAFARTDPWMCPSDREQATIVGVSYTYAPWSLFQLALEEENPRRLVSNLWLSHASAVVFMDQTPWHGLGLWSGRNGVHVDGSAGQLDGRNGLGIAD